MVTVRDAITTTPSTTVAFYDSSSLLLITLRCELAIDVVMCHDDNDDDRINITVFMPILYWNRFTDHPIDIVECIYIYICAIFSGKLDVNAFLHDIVEKRKVMLIVNIPSDIYILYFCQISTIKLTTDGRKFISRNVAMHYM